MHVDRKIQGQVTDSYTSPASALSRVCLQLQVVNLVCIIYALHENGDRLLSPFSWKWKSLKSKPKSPGSELLIKRWGASAHHPLKLKAERIKQANLPPVGKSTAIKSCCIYAYNSRYRSPPSTRLHWNNKKLKANADKPRDSNSNSNGVSHPLKHSITLLPNRGAEFSRGLGISRENSQYWGALKPHRPCESAVVVGRIVGVPKFGGCWEPAMWRGWPPTKTPLLTWTILPNFVVLC